MSAHRIWTICRKISIGKLMRCHFVRGQFAETANAFRRCRELLSTVLRVNPSAETESLYQQALDAQQ